METCVQVQPVVQHPTRPSLIKSPNFYIFKLRACIVALGLVFIICSFFNRQGSLLLLQYMLTGFSSKSQSARECACEYIRHCYFLSDLFKVSDGENKKILWTVF